MAYLPYKGNGPGNVHNTSVGCWFVLSLRTFVEVSLQLFEKARILVDKSFSRILAMRLVKDGFFG